MNRKNYFLFQVPGRLGLLVTLCLIVTNVYNAVTAPSKRGFSFIEVWMIGVQVPILIGILEYGTILAFKKYAYGRERSLIKVGNQTNVSSKTSSASKKFLWDDFDKTLDKWTFILTSLFIMIFNIIYWSVASSM